MQAKTALARDGLRLVYYVGGEGERQLVIANPAGMSVRFWLPIIRRLERRHRILAFDYRGSPASGDVLSVETATFARCLDDLDVILETERIPQADYLSWCGGTSLVMAVHERRPEAVRSLAAVGVTFGNKNDPSQFVSAIYDIKQAIDENPACIDRMVLRMKMLGLVRETPYFEAIHRAGDGAADTGLYDVLGNDGPLSTLGFSLFDSATALQNYLGIFHEFNRSDRPVREIGKPVLLINGDRGSSASGVTPTPRLRSDSENIWEVTLAQSSEFLLLERPREIADQIVNHLARRATKERDLTAYAEARGASDGP